MNLSDNPESLQHDLRIAELEISALKEELRKAVEQAQRTRDEMRDMLTQLARQSAGALPSDGNLPNPTDPSAVSAPTVRSSNGQSDIPTRFTILCIEDNEPQFRLVESILEDMPRLELLWSPRAAVGLETATARHPQLILLDLDLPDMHGSEVLMRLQGNAATANIPVIIISADANPSRIERMLEAGARNYLTKPFDIRRFSCMIEEIVAETAGSR